MIEDRSEDPEAATAVIQKIIFGPVPEVGTRHETLLELGYRAGEAGHGNDWICRALSTACDLWGLHPNVFDRWTRLLNILRRVRKTYPNGPNGEGWRPGIPPASRQEEADS